MFIEKKQRLVSFPIKDDKLRLGPDTSRKWPGGIWQWTRGSCWREGPDRPSRPQRSFGWECLWRRPQSSGYIWRLARIRTGQSGRSCCCCLSNMHRSCPGCRGRADAEIVGSGPQVRRERSCWLWPLSLSLRPLHLCHRWVKIVRSSRPVCPCEQKDDAPSLPGIYIFLPR